MHLKQLAEKAQASVALLAGIGHNAGVVDIGQGYAVTFKIESHNHPSYVEPNQGAATGTGGMRVRLDAVPLRDAFLGPPEILMSESQERRRWSSRPESSGSCRYAPNRRSRPR